MRKFAALLLVLALVVAIVPTTNVRAQDNSGINCFTDEEATVVVAAGAVGIELQLAQEAAEAFMEACPNITVNVLETPDMVQDRLGLYLQLFEAQSPDVDVFQIDVIWPGERPTAITSCISSCTKLQTQGVWIPAFAGMTLKYKEKHIMFR